jgi:hypothetical protein
LAEVWPQKLRVKAGKLSPELAKTFLSHHVIKGRL